MTRTLSATEVARNFSSVLDDVEHAGQRVRIERHGHVVAELGPPSVERRCTWGELVDLLQRLEQPDTHFARDLGEAHRLLNEPVRDAWGVE
jgi:antitoxin (DNA-binding transcriptional repressor) of toxin-antitoxin stability system